MERKKLGQLGERIAENLLVSSGYVIQERNFRCFLGEIDLIAEDNLDLVFIEVRTKTSLTHGTPHESITKSKQQRLHRIAAYYLNKTKQEERSCRFDVVLIQMNGNSQVKEIEIIRNVF